MVKIVYKKRGIPVSHVWYSEGIQREKESITMYHRIKDPECSISWNGVVNKTNQFTLISNLLESEEKLWNAIHKTTKKQIRRAEKEGVVVDYYEGTSIPMSIFDSFESTYNNMFVSKGKATKFNKPLVNEYMKRNAITFSIASYRNTPLVFHSYISDNNHTRAYYSCSPYHVDSDLSKLIGEMNRYLQWKDMLYFKEKGISEYDWGGINDLDQPNDIAKFKMSFGGVPVKYYNYLVSNTLLGKTLLKLFIKKHRLD